MRWRRIKTKRRRQKGRAERRAGEKPKEEISVTDHTIKIGGQTIPYKATAQTILLKDEKGAPWRSFIPRVHAQ